MNNDLYKVLDVEKTSTAEEIKKAYRKLSLKYHPDRNQGNAESTKKFQEIFDTEKRQKIIKDLLELDGIGETQTNSLETFFSNKNNRHE